MALLDKAKDLGEEIRNTPEYRELEKKGQNLKEDESAQQLIRRVEEIQKQLAFSQQAGVQPKQEQIEEFNNLREEMHANSTVRDFIKAQQDFNSVMETVNNAIGKGITGEDQQK